MTYVLAQLASLGALVAAFGVGGIALERALPGPPVAAELRPLARCVLGLALWVAGLFLLSCVGVLGTAAVLAGSGACALAWVATRRRVGPPPPPWLWTGSLRFLAAAWLFTLPAWLLALSWSVSWDAGTYHLALPKRYLEAGGFVPVAGNVYSNWPLATELLYAAALAIGSHPLAKALHGVFGLATLWTLWLAARSFDREAAGWIAALALLASPVVLFEWSVAYVDLASAFFFSAGFLFLVRWRAAQGEGGEARRELWLAGVCAGMLAATKVNGVVGSAVLGCALLGPLAARARRGEARAAGADALRFGVPVLALWLPWLAKSAAYTGNPVYPLAFGWLGGPDWSPRLGEQLVAWQRSIGMGRGLADFLWLPLRVTLEAGPGYDRFGGVIGAHWLAAPVLAAAGWRHPLVRAGLLVSGVGFAAWALGSQQARFLIPLLPVLALCAALGALEGLARVGGASARRVGAALLAVAALGLAVQTMRRPAAEARALWPRLSAGAEALRADAVQPLHHFVATLPADAHLLLLDTNQVFFLERASWSDSFFEASQIADALRGAESAEQAHALLRERGITHVLRARIEWGIDWPAGLVALLEDPRLSRRRFLASDGRHEVFELLPRDPA